jgi:hypothetical protein
MRHGRSKFIVYRDLEDGYRWRQRSDTGETLAASSAVHPTRGACETDLRAFMADHRPGEAEVLDATARGRGY